MATSSIFAKIRISDPEKVEALIDALEKAENRPRKKSSKSVQSLITDIDEIRKIMSKRFPI